MWKTHPTLPIWESAGAQLPVPCSRGDLLCQVDLWCVWVDRSPRAREEVGLQRKEERRLNLNQNVWLPTLGREKGNGGGWQVKKHTRKLFYQIGKMWKDLNIWLHTKSLVFQPLLAHSLTRALQDVKGFPLNQNQAPEQSFSRDGQEAPDIFILNGSVQTRQTSKCIFSFRYTENVWLHLQPLETATVRYPWKQDCQWFSRCPHTWRRASGWVC